MNYLEMHGYEKMKVGARRTWKRPSPYCPSNHEDYAPKSRKAGASGKRGMFQKSVLAQHLGKVDDVAYPKENLGEKYMHASPNNGYSEIKRSTGNCFAECPFAESLECNEFDTSSSVGSCSITSNDQKKFYPIRHRQDSNLYSSDAESTCFRFNAQEKSSISSEEELKVKYHRLELDSYCHTLGGLFASGPLSWENEAVLTNLRLSLHISNDEHLMELRNLIYARSRLCIS